MDRLTPSRRARWHGPLGLLLAVLPALPLAAQPDRDRLRDRCDGGGAPPGRCLDAALAVEAVAGGVGLALSGGNEFPGSASTLGKRFGTTPRVAAGVRLAALELDLPDVGDGAGAVGTASSWLPSVQAAVAVNLFDGFRPRPTVGGVLAVDLMATAGFAFLPSGAGFDGGAGAFGYGVRLGLLRESFTLPGVTVSAVRRHGGGVEWNGPDGDIDGVVDLDGTTTTSLRGTVGREFSAVGIQAGLGWDRVAADGLFRPAGGSPSSASVDVDGFEADRVLFFGGLTLTWLVTQIHAELGYASGYDAVPDPDPDSFDPSAGTLLASLTFRVLF